MKPEADDTRAPQIPHYNCRCGQTFTSAVALVRHTATCETLQQEMDH